MAPSVAQDAAANGSPLDSVQSVKSALLNAVGSHTPRSGSHTPIDHKIANHA